MVSSCCWNEVGGGAKSSSPHPHSRVYCTPKGDCSSHSPRMAQHQDRILVSTLHIWLCPPTHCPCSPLHRALFSRFLPVSTPFPQSSILTAPLPLSRGLTSCRSPHPHPCFPETARPSRHGDRTDCSLPPLPGITAFPAGSPIQPVLPVMLCRRNLKPPGARGQGQGASARPGRSRTGIGVRGVPAGATSPRRAKIGLADSQSADRKGGDVTRRQGRGGEGE